MNLTEAGESTGHLGYDKRIEAASKLKESFGSKYVVITCGEHGMVSFDGNYHDIPTMAKEVIDVSGAGDTVVSVAALCLAAGLKPEMIAEISNIAGGLVCESVGVVPIDKEQLMEETIALLVK